MEHTRLISALEAPGLAGEEDEDAVTNKLKHQLKLPQAPREGKLRPREAIG